jgi:hypothetical protein
LLFLERCDEAFEARAVVGGEARLYRAVNIEDAEQLAAAQNWNDDFAARRAVADDVIGEGVDIIHNERFFLCRRGSTDAARSWNSRAGGASAERTEHEFARRRREIKAGSVNVGKLGVNQRCEVAGVGHEVGLAVEQRAYLRFEALEEFGRHWV